MGSVALSEKDVAEIGPTRKNLEKLLSQIDQMPALTGVGVEFRDGPARHEIRAARGYLAPSLVMERRWRPSAPPEKKREYPGLGRALLDVTIDCGGTALAAAATSASAASTPVTFGLGAIPTAILGAGTAAGALKCGVSATRLANVVGDNKYFNAENNKLLDQNEYWQWGITVLDAVGMAAMIVNLPQAISNARGLVTLKKWSGRVPELGRLPKKAREEVMREVGTEVAGLVKNSDFKHWVRRQGVSRKFSADVMDQLTKQQLVHNVSDAFGIADSAKTLGDWYGKTSTSEPPLNPSLSGVTVTPESTGEAGLVLHLYDRLDADVPDNMCVLPTGPIDAPSAPEMKAAP